MNKDISKFLGKKVRVYRNLTKKCWSVQHNGLVVTHCDEIILFDVEFKVSEAGRQRVLKELRKNVHAYAEGKVWKHAKPLNFSFPKEVAYNPYLKGSFYEKDTKEDIVWASSAYFKDGKVFVD